MNSPGHSYIFGLMRRGVFGWTSVPHLRALSSIILGFSLGIGPLALASHPCQTSAGTESHQHHGTPGSDSAPAPEPTVPAECSCIGAACHMSQAQLPAPLAVPAAQLVSLFILPTHAPVAVALPAVAHLLPYAQAPPSTLSA